MKKIILIFLLFTGTCLLFQKSGQRLIASMAIAEKDNDPNSSTRMMAAEQRAFTAKVEAAQEKVETAHEIIRNRLDADLERRLRAAGELPLNLSKGEVLIYLFNDSRREVSFSIMRADKTKYAADVAVPAGRFEKVAIKDNCLAYVRAKESGRTWEVDPTVHVEHGKFVSFVAFGCVYQ